MRQHLIQCDKYLNLHKAKGVENAITRQAAATKQTQLNIPRLSSATKDLLDMDFAEACYVSGAPFTIFQDDAMIRAFQTLNPAYKPPTRKALAGPLLDKVYSSLKEKVDKAVEATKLLNIVTDESSNISRSRIANISIHTTSGVFHWRSEDIGARRMTSINIADWVKHHLTKLCNGQFNRVNSITTDTCNAMLRAWEILEQFVEFRHCFFIPCDSHGLQLVIKDMLEIPELKELHDVIQSIAKAFKNAPLQYARLRECQLAKYNRKQALCLSVITRWGTQFRLVSSVYKNKEALRMYSYQYAVAGQSSDIAKDLVDKLVSPAFWTTVEMFKELLEPIDEAIRMSESDKAHLGHVLPRWAEIMSHLKRSVTSFPGLHEYLEFNGGFNTRYHRQVKPIHIIATYLDPKHWELPMGADTEHQIYQFIDKYTNTEDEATAARCEFLSFRSQLPPFESTRYCWKHSTDPRMFWIMQTQHAKVIGALAVRIYSTPSNSVPSERAFSVMNFIHRKGRNSLGSEKVDKLTYTYINTRLFRRTEGARFVSDLSEISEEEEVELEDMLMQEEGISDIDESEDDES
jgi:hypothetical protein